MYIWSEQVRRLRAPGYQALRTQRRDPTRGRQSIPWRYPPLRSLCPQRCRASAAPVPPATDGGLTSSASGWLSAAASLPAQPDVDALGLPRAHQLLSAVARRSRDASHARSAPSRHGRVPPRSSSSPLLALSRREPLWPALSDTAWSSAQCVSESRLERATASTHAPRSPTTCAKSSQGGEQQPVANASRRSH